MECMVCGRLLQEREETCSRCGFRHRRSLTDPETTRHLMQPLVDSHLANLLQAFDLGVTTYHWKDQDGAIVRDFTRRLSFGTTSALMDNTVWLDQPFARLPDAQEITVELSIIRNGTEPVSVPVQLPALREAQLQYVGLRLDRKLMLSLFMKNEDSQVSSAPIDLLKR